MTAQKGGGEVDERMDLQLLVRQQTRVADTHVTSSNITRTHSYWCEASRTRDY